MSQDTALCPDDFTGLTVEPAESTAVGLNAVVKSIAHAWGNAGIIRGTKALQMLNQIGGVDCPSCAWPDPDDHRSAAEFCENGAKAVAWEADKRKFTAAEFAKRSVAELATLSDYEHGQLGRLTEPMVLKPGSTHYTPISWDDAFQLIASELNQLASPDEAIFYTSGRASNEAAFLYQLFVRQFGTNKPAGLLEHVSRVVRCCFGQHHRHRQGHGQAPRLRESRSHPDPRAKPRHQPPADAHGVAEGQASGGQDRRHQSLEGSGAIGFPQSAGSGRVDGLGPHRTGRRLPASEDRR